MLLLSVIFTWFAVLAPSMAENETERRVATLEYKFARHERKLEDVERDVYAISRNQGQTAGGLPRNGCPSGFTSNKDSCYLFGLKAVDWLTAVQQCSIQSYDTYLVMIDSIDESNFIKGKAATFGGSYWIGLTDKELEGAYMWWRTGHVSESGDFTDWAAGEPSTGGSKNCVFLDKDKSHKWTVFPCSRNFYYICETEARY